PTPSHPTLIQVNRSPIPFASGAYSLVSAPAGSVLCKITGTTPSKKAYTSVQTGRDSHIELNSDLVYCNHSCDPTVNFDMHKMEVRVVDNRDLKAGERSGEKCKGQIDGAKNLSTEVLGEYWLNPHIEEMVAERE
ncbi:hypothetical protein ASPNIDRAFT_137748, partial [Aspergillus niger ATCC 1015]